MQVTKKKFFGQLTLTPADDVRIDDSSSAALSPRLHESHALAPAETQLTQYTLADKFLAHDKHRVSLVPLVSQRRRECW